MKKQSSYFLVLLATAVAFASCKSNVDFKKTKSGLTYKLFSDSKDTTAKEGNIIKFNYTVKIGSTDSLLSTTYGKMPGYAMVEKAQAEAYSPTELFDQLHKGDSLIVVQFVDSIIKKTPGGSLPPFLKKGDKIVLAFKVLDIFKSPDGATADRNIEGEKEKVRLEKETETDLVKQNADMADWLTKNNVAAQKIGKGTYVVVKEPGAGIAADSGKYVTVRYAGKTLSNGKEFESTMDPKKQPFTFIIGTGGAIRGWDEGLKLFKKGGKGTLYIPGALAYGKNPPQGSPFKPDEALIFDIDVIDISDKQPEALKQPPQQQMPEEMRKQMEQQQQQQQPPKGN